MRYYIYADNKPVEVSEAIYIQWETSEKYKFSFEDYFLQASNHTYKIQIAYLGVCSDFETPKPFVLEYSKTVRENGIDKSEINVTQFLRYHSFPIDFGGGLR